MSSIDFSIRQLRYFVCTAEMGQISQAALELNITQSAITASIKELENRLGTQLFIRQPSGMFLTDAGQHFLNHCYDILDSVAACQTIRFQDNEIKGVLKVAATYTVIGYFLPFHLQRLKKIYPNLQIQLTERSRQQVETSLLSGEIDLAVLLSSNVNNDALCVKSFMQSERQLWVSQNHHLLERPEVDFKDIISEPYIMLTIDEAAATSMNYWKSMGLNPNVILNTSSVEAVRSLVANGEGITILSDAVYRPWSLEGKKINRIKLKSRVPTMNLGVAWPANTTLNKAQIAFTDYFLNHLSVQ